MPRESIRVRAQDLRAVYLLVGECCELGADPLVWRRHMLQRLNEFFGAAASVDIEATFDPASPGVGATPQLAMTVDHLGASEREFLVRCLQEMPLEANPLGMSVASRRPAGGAVAAVRREHVADSHWRRCPFLTDYFAPLGWDDMMIAMVDVPGGFRCCNFARERRSGNFPLRAARMLELFVGELARIPATRLAPLSGGSLLELPPRLRDVLVAMTHGDNEKQIAVRLGISRNTVHEYVRRLFARFGVSSRGQLLVRAARQLHALEASASKATDYWFYQQGIAS